MTDAPEPLWEPTDERRERAAITRYARWLRDGRGVAVDPDGDYNELWQWSVDNLDEFWASIWDFFEVEASQPYERVLGDRSMPGAEWFPGTRLNYAQHVFRGKDPSEVALRHASELRELDEWTWGELRASSASIAAGLRGIGVEPGDRVAAYFPNIPEALAAFLACASIGAVWSSASPDFGARSVVDRFAQIEPKVLLAVDGYRYGGKDFDRCDVVRRLVGEMPSLQRVVVLPYLGCGTIDGAVDWDEAFPAGGDDGADLHFEQLPFDHPLWVLYSSGTTGLPKPIVHGAGGILLEQLKKLNLHLDAQAGDRVFWFTTTGWMMWNFLVGVLLTDASIVLYDGNPGTPDMGVLWDLAERAGITCFGTSASYIASCMKAGVEPASGRDLGALDRVGSTGSPLSPEGFQWVYEQLGADTWLFSTSGGTDVCTAFVGGVPTLPVYLGELQGRSLGAAVESWDEDGNALVGEMGELVITEPMPSMPLFFWGDEDGSRLHESYFSTYEGVWRHGDWIEITARGTAIIYGRSDSTINRGGIRMGTSEIYSAVLALDEIVDALVVDVPRDGSDSWMPLFVVLREGATLDDSLVAAIKKRIREDCSPRHTPNEVRAIDEVPRTLSGKVLEVPVKRILMGDSPDKAAARDSLQNPAALDYFVELAGSGGRNSSA
ncbi:MAG: acetoacetyl-CoA synthetase [Thermoleophilaceae bacterium]|nr:acetoacetyl-CoA synthetase [Thermoleophilaceae bacterium]MEA2470119.1 acetoacetyl-CoA synthetase [Thermoleophilaceae bacterium]